MACLKKSSDEAIMGYSHDVTSTQGVASNGRITVIAACGCVSEFDGAVYPNSAVAIPDTDHSKMVLWSGSSRSETCLRDRKTKYKHPQQRECAVVMDTLKSNLGKLDDIANKCVVGVRYKSRVTKRGYATLPDIQVGVTGSRDWCDGSEADPAGLSNAFAREIGEEVGLDIPAEGAHILKGGEMMTSIKQGFYSNPIKHKIALVNGNRDTVSHLTCERIAHLLAKPVASQCEQTGDYIDSQGVKEKICAIIIGDRDILLEKIQASLENGVGDPGGMRKLLAGDDIDGICLIDLRLAVDVYFK